MKTKYYTEWARKDKLDHFQSDIVKLENSEKGYERVEYGLSQFEIIIRVVYKGTLMEISEYKEPHEVKYDYGKYWVMRKSTKDEINILKAIKLKER